MLPVSDGIFSTVQKSQAASYFFEILWDKGKWANLNANTG